MANNTDIPDIEKKIKEASQDGQDFEEAIKATGFGKFNLFVWLAVLPASVAVVQETTTMSYVFLAAQCDLDLNLEDKGMLNAITYAGSISSAFLWGYLFDTYGRKNLIAYGLLLQGLVIFLSAFSQNLTFLMVTKFIGGFLMSGPWGGLASYLSETHSHKYRNHMPLLMGFSASFGAVIIPILAGYVLPLKIHETNLVFGKSLNFYAWSFFLLLCSLPSFLSGVWFIFCPESPKFLMAKGEHDKALSIFKRIYKLNTGKPEDTYPIKKLKMTIREKITSNDVNKKFSKTSALKQGCSQMTPLLSAPHLKNFILVCLIQLFSLLDLNTIRLWTPQILQAVNDYESNNNGSATLCIMLDTIRPSSINSTKECIMKINNEVYINSTIINLITVATYLLAVSIMKKFGPKILLCIINIGVGIFATALYFAPNGFITVIFLTGFTALGSLASSVILAIVANLFPTTLRTMAISMVMMSGRGAGMIGNVIFPILLEIACYCPFIMFSLVAYANIIVTSLLPSSKRRVSIMVDNISLPPIK